MGYEPEELVGRDASIVIRPEDIIKVLEYLPRLFSGELKYLDKIEVPAKKKDGTLAIIEWQASPILTEGEINGIQLIGRDITEKKHQEDLLKLSEEKFRDLAEMLPLTIFELDENLNLVYSNRQGELLSGYVMDDFKENRTEIFDIFAPEDLERMMHNIRKLITSEKTSSHEYTLIRKDGVKKSVIINSRSIYKNKKFSGIYGVIIDITERKALEQELLQKNQELNLSLIHI